MLKNISVGAGKFLGVRRIFAQISPNLPKKYSKKMTSKQKRLHFDLKCYFCKIKAHTAVLRRYSHILLKFPHIFCPDFHQIKSFGGPLTPRLLHQR